MHTTKDNILDAAERLFAERGFEAISLRAITAAAGANLAAVNYHFRSKERLLQALFRRGMQRLSRKRIAMLDAFESEYGNNPVPPEKLARVLVEPMFDISGELSKNGKIFSMLLGRMYSSPQGWLDRLPAGDVGKFAERFEPALRRSLPGISSEDLYWRSFFAIGAAAHTLVSPHLLHAASRGLCNPDDREAALERLVAFVVAGLKQPAKPGIHKKSAGRNIKTNRGK